ncbi:MAG: hypothetical protein BWY63_01974 [Chloroflexi bacterium ADurb.Bin360]|nr:MAG: hypothetical protein BWY63_01974 [Chloroflexi bacterium ADurb.Bin360]
MPAKSSLASPSRANDFLSFITGIIINSHNALHQPAGWIENTECLIERDLGQYIGAPDRIDFHLAQ